VQVSHRFGALSRNSDFLWLWGAQSVSSVGARITRDGLPIAAVLASKADPVELGILSALTAGPSLIVGLVSGGFVDRSRRKTIMIAADLLRAGILLSVPIASWLGPLSMLQLYLVGACVGAASVLFDLADKAYLPALIRNEELVEGNTKLEMTESIAEIGGPAIAGALFQFLSAPIALIVNVVTHLVSALALAQIRERELASVEAEPGTRLSEDIATGFRIVARDPRVWPIFCTGVTDAFFGSFFGALYVFFALRVLHLSTEALGLTIAMGGVGGIIGAGLAGSLGRRLGIGKALIIGLIGSGLFRGLIPLAAFWPAAGIGLLMIAQIAGDACAVGAAVIATSLRQSVLPLDQLGRSTAICHVGTGAAAVLGAVIGGVLGNCLGARETLFIAAAGSLVAPLWVIVSPLRSLVSLAEAAAEGAGGAS
jgi:MFS family permease